METKQSLVAPGTLWWMPLVRGILLVIFGLMMFAWGRGATLLGVIQFLGAYWLVGGIFDLFEGFVGRPEGSRIWMIVSAVVSMAAGFFVLGHPIVSGLVIGTYLTFIMGFAAAAVGVIHIFSGSKKKRFWGGTVLGIFYTIFGVAIVFNPLVTQAVILLLLPYWAIIAGALAIFTAYKVRGTE